MMNVDIVLYKEQGFENVPFRFYFRFEEEHTDKRQPRVCITGPWEDDYLEYRHMTAMVPSYFHQVIYDEIDYKLFKETYEEMEYEEERVIKTVAITNIVIWLNSSVYIDYHGKRVRVSRSTETDGFLITLDNDQYRYADSLSEIKPYIYLLNDNLYTLALGQIDRLRRLLEREKGRRVGGNI